MKQLSNKRFESRLARIEKIMDLMETGLAPTEIAGQLGVRWETVKSDLELIPVLAKGLLSPETCAEKRQQLNNYYDDMVKETREAYRECRKDGLHKEAGIYGRMLIEVLKGYALLWGLPDAKVETMGAGSMVGGKVSFTKVDVKIGDKEYEELKQIVSRRG